ncbi:hypothetical protein LFAB_10540 [Lactiplantibacillus fabifermentans T30PCM01]|uniref:Uncharacterized protein n=1 Tax=Lactiplantibacillus fabifermentans T30PCM01 TaxID=1400520 RepID=W6T6Q5_9LACO|nr:hypothetical protein LFAB_10540 [Lactiplantibacillus fabifermentans T30PCM01]
MANFTLKFVSCSDVGRPPCRNDWPAGWAGESLGPTFVTGSGVWPGGKAPSRPYFGSRSASQRLTNVRAAATQPQTQKKKHTTEVMCF